MSRRGAPSFGNLIDNTGHTRREIKSNHKHLVATLEQGLR